MHPPNICVPLFLSICACLVNSPCHGVLNAATNAPHHPASPPPPRSAHSSFSPSSSNPVGLRTFRQISNVSPTNMVPSSLPSTPMGVAQNYSSQKIFKHGKEIPSNNQKFKMIKTSGFKVTAVTGFPERWKSRFNYENQLEIMLEKQRELTKQRILLNRTVFQSTPQVDIPYNVFAIKAAKFDVKSFRKNYVPFISEGQQSDKREMISGSRYLLIIAKAMRQAIDFYNSSMRRKAVEELTALLQRADPSAAHGAEKEQLRFVGLVLWHLVFRDCPIVDPTADEFVFSAKIEPNIDATDPNVASAFCAELDDELARKRHGMAKGEEKKLMSEEMHKEFEKDFEQFERLEDKLFKEGHENVELEKYNELYEKFELLRVYWGWAKGKKADRKIPFYDKIDRAFIAYGGEAPALIVFVRALLEGATEWTDFSKYILNPTQNALRICKDNEKYEQMERQLLDLSKRYGL